jgi:hypothetical protein
MDQGDAYGKTFHNMRLLCFSQGFKQALISLILLQYG